MSATGRRQTGASAARKGQRLPAAERRERLLDVTADLMRQAGFEGMSMESVANAAGVSKGLCYAYFKNLDDLLLALHERETARMYADMERSVTAGGGFEERVANVVGALVEHVRQRGMLLVLLRTRLSDDARAPGDAERTESWESTMQVAVEEELPVAQKDARALVMMMLNSCDGAARMWAEAEVGQEELQAGCSAFLAAGARGAVA